MNLWLLGFTPILLVITAVPIIRGGSACRSYWLAWCGLAATIIGDYFLAIKNAPLYSSDFLYGVAGFSLAQGCWIAFLRHHAKGSVRIAAILLFSFGILFQARIIPALHSIPLAAALTLYTLLSITSVSYACGTHNLSPAWRYGIFCLFFSDILIAFRSILGVPHLGHFVGITYLSSLVFIATAIMTCGRKQKTSLRFRYLRNISWVIFLGGALALIFFLLAMKYYPGETYNPCRCTLVAIFESFILLHRFKILSWSPYVPTCQKILILTFIVWIEYYAFILLRRTRRFSARAPTINSR